MPRDVTNLWVFVAELDHDSRMALFAHCVALTVNAVKLPWERKPRAMATADRLAEAVSLDMTGYWRPTVRISGASPKRAFDAFSQDQSQKEPLAFGKEERLRSRPGCPAPSGAAGTARSYGSDRLGQCQSRA
jgi:hypothetical protein